MSWLDNAPRLPRSLWPKGHFRISAIHEDKHINKLLAAGSELGAEDPTSQIFPATLPPRLMASLVDTATSTDDFYVASVVMDRLFDAYDSFPAIIGEFAGRTASAPERIKRRIAACLFYLLLLPQCPNRRPIKGKIIQEIQADAAHFQILAEQAREIIRELDPKIHLLAQRQKPNQASQPTPPKRRG
jgi:hypothetical protein